MNSSEELEYAGFWIRVWACLIDTVLLCVLLFPLLTAVYGTEYWVSTDLIHGPMDFLISWVMPAAVVLVFWISRQATPGKMAISARIVDAKTGQNASTAQLVGRYLGYFVATIPLGLGLIWVGLDARKQGWHDKLAGTVVVRKKGGATQAVKFNAD